MIASAVARRGQDAHRDEPGADVERIVSPARAADRCRSAKADAASSLSASTTASGLIEGLDGQADRSSCCGRSSTASVGAAGGPPNVGSDGGAHIASACVSCVEEAKKVFDWIIIDTPPLMLLPDAHLLSDWSTARFS